MTGRDHDVHNEFSSAYGLKRTANHTLPIVRCPLRKFINPVGDEVTAVLCAIVRPCEEIARCQILVSRVVS
jgi:hypothetical protein